MEYRELYDENRKKLNQKIIKDDPVPKGTYYTVVYLFVEDDNHKFLIQKRTPDKNGKWSITSGHPKGEETSLDGVLAEAKEELGLTLDKDKLILYDTQRTDHFFGDFYYIQMPITLEDIVLQKEEVDDVRFATLDEIEELIFQDEFMDKHVPWFYRFKTYYENKE